MKRLLSSNDLNRDLQGKFYEEVKCSFADPIAATLYSVDLYSKVKAKGINLAMQKEDNDNWVQRAERLRDEVKEKFKENGKEAELLGEEIYILSLASRDASGGFIVDFDGDLKADVLTRFAYSNFFGLGSRSAGSSPE